MTGLPPSRWSVQLTDSTLGRGAVSRGRGGEGGTEFIIIIIIIIIIFTIINFLRNDIYLR